MKGCDCLRIFRKNKHETQSILEKKIQDYQSSIRVEKNSDLDKQLKIIGMTEEDLAILRVLKEHVEPHIDAIANRFYAALTSVPELSDIIMQNSSVDRLKQTLHRHISEMFNGAIDNDFIDKRIRIANAHVRIGLNQKWYIASFQIIYTSLIEIIQNTFSSRDDYFRAIQAVTKLLNFEQQLVLEAYDRKMESLRKEAFDAQEQLKNFIGLTADELTKLTLDSSSSIQQITAQVEAIAQQSRKNTSMAAEAENTAIAGKERLDNLFHAFDQVQTSMKNIKQNIESLEKTAAQISEIVEIVKSVADQTNLLALNASIEAARAGEHGRGFAVVAEEVRKLAEQTSESVSHVSALISETNEKIYVNSESIKEIEQNIELGGKKMDETNAAFENIVHVMKETKEMNERIQADLENVNKVVNEIASVAETVSASAERLNEAITKLK